MGEQGVNGLANEAGKRRVDQYRLAFRIEADDADGGIVKNGAEKGFPFLQDGLALSQGDGALGDFQFKVDVGILMCLTGALQMLAHAFQRGGQRDDFTPRRIGGNRLIECQLSDPGAVFGQCIQWLAEAAGDMEGDGHAEGDGREQDESEQQQVVAGYRDKIALRCNDTQPDSAGIVVQAPKQADHASVGARKGVQAAVRLGVSLPKPVSLGKFG